ncbi:MAG: histidinol phosphatase, partial [Gemmatimonadetes bacterium]|nr:histidinol phosphatase [Gemmatimonadota bacterium]
FPGRAAALRQELGRLDVDYLIGAVHSVGAFEVDAAPSSWARLNPDERERVHRRYWTRLRSLAESGLFDIVAHLDLTKKNGYPPQEPIDDLVAPTLDAIATAGLVVELNTAGWHKPIGDAYPDEHLLAECRRRDIPVTLSADAHRPEDLLRDFDRGAERLRAAGYGEIARFRERRVTFDPL